MQRIAFRCDATLTSGGGHVMRCLTLAEEMKRLGEDVLILTNDEALDLVPALATCQSRVAVVDPGPQAVVEALRIHWDVPADVVVLDHYGWGDPSEASLREAAKKVVVIDDLANRRHDCDVLLDSNLGRYPEDYAGRVPTACQLLIGTGYALLRPEFPALRRFALARRIEGSPVRRILISMGLTDVGGITLTIVQALRRAGITVDLDVIVGPTASSLAGLRGLADPALCLHIAPPDVGALMAKADLAVGAGGSSTWERCCLGLPSVILVLADNQRSLAMAVAEAGAASMIDKPDSAAIGEAVLTLMRDDGLRTQMSAHAAALCDGLGVKRVAAMILGGDADLRLRRADATDVERLWEWRNDPGSRAASRNDQFIPFADHIAWYQHALKDVSRIILIGEMAGRPIGTVRFDPCGPQTFEVSITLDPDMKSQGLGRKLLAAAIDWQKANQPSDMLRATAREMNTASINAFAACGFSASPPTGGWVHMNWTAAPNE
jgi:UDP-2,4-diacetamido-2,4,6-trideoxy-beta-L-altropyranose hydrolase